VMRGYWNLPAETEKKLRPGIYPGEKVLYTGDLFKQDEEEFLYFIARQDDLIKTGGELVSPKEVENVLYDLEGVAEAAVMGIEDGILGQAVKAIVVPKSGAELAAQAVRAHCARNLERYKVPKVVEFRTGLAKTLTGKTLKRDQAGEERTSCAVSAEA
jgi:long-chain acyl-CoA synthetase